MELKEGDFVSVEFDLYANDKLVQTTDEKKAKEHDIKSEEFKAQTMILGKAFLLKALDDDILKTKDDKSHTLDLKVEEAFGKRQKKLIRVLPKSAFDEHGQRPVVGVVYDFNGMYGTVKSIVGGRVMVDFNNPLSGKNIKIEYKVVSKIDDIAVKSTEVLKKVLKIPENMFNISSKEKELTIKVPEQLVAMKDVLVKGIEEFVPEIKEYSVKVEKK